MESQGEGPLLEWTALFPKGGALVPLALALALATGPGHAPGLAPALATAPALVRAPGPWPCPGHSPWPLPLALATAPEPCPWPWPQPLSWLQPLDTAPGPGHSPLPLAAAPGTRPSTGGSHPSARLSSQGAWALDGVVAPPGIPLLAVSHPREVPLRALG